jgi:LysR substrate binding domain
VKLAQIARGLNTTPNYLLRLKLKRNRPQLIRSRRGKSSWGLWKGCFSFWSLIRMRFARLCDIVLQVTNRAQDREPTRRPRCGVKATRFKVDPRHNGCLQQRTPLRDDPHGVLSLRQHVVAPQNRHVIGGNRHKIGSSRLGQAPRLGKLAGIGLLRLSAKDWSALSGSLRLGVIPAAMPPCLTARFLSAHPAASVEVMSMTSRSIQKALDSFEIDAGVTNLDKEPLEHVRPIPLYKERYICVTSGGGRDANAAWVTDTVVLRGFIKTSTQAQAAWRALR